MSTKDAFPAKTTLRLVRPSFVNQHLMKSNFGGNTAVLSVAGRGSEFDASGDEPNAVIGASLSSHPKAGAYDFRLGGECRNPIRASGRAVAVQTEIDAGINNLD